MVLGDRTLVWVRSRAFEELRESADAVFFGTAPEECADPLTAASAPLASGVLILRRDPLVIRPVGLRGAFTDAAGRSSDSSLLLGAVNEAPPQWRRVVQLAGAHALLGNHSLFEGIDRVPVLHELAIASSGVVTARALPSPVPVPDEAAFLDVLTELARGAGTALLALTGGYDSRLVLGALRRAQRDVLLVHETWKPADERAARRIADALLLELIVVPNTAREVVPDIALVVANDAQVTYRAGSFSSFVHPRLDPHRAVYTGQFADVTTKNAWPVAFVGNAPFGDQVARLVDRKLLVGVSPLGCAPEEAREEIINELRRHTPPVETRSRKGIVGWHYYASRGMRWIEGHHADLALFHEVLSPLGDLRLVLHGVLGSTWGDMGHERARRLNAALGMGLGVGYTDGGPATPGTGLGAARRRAKDFVVYSPLRPALLRYARPVAAKAGRVLHDEDLAALSSHMAGGRDAEAIVASSPTRDDRRALITAAHACRVLAALRTADPRGAMLALAGACDSYAR